MTTSAVVKRKFDSKSNYDPVRKTGLLPRGESHPKSGSSSAYDREAGATYVLSGHVINNTNTVDSAHVSEQMGREGQARAQRAEARRQEDALLKKMLKTEKTQDNGSHVKSILMAREAIDKVNKEKQLLKKTKRKSRKDEDNVDDEEEEVEEKAEEHPPAAARYRPEMIKSLGFDPVAMKLGPQRQNTADVQRKVRSGYSSSMNATEDFVVLDG